MSYNHPFTDQWQKKNPSKAQVVHVEASEPDASHGAAAHAAHGGEMEAPLEAKCPLWRFPKPCKYPT